MMRFSWLFLLAAVAIAASFALAVPTFDAACSNGGYSSTSKAALVHTDSVTILCLMAGIGTGDIDSMTCGGVQMGRLKDSAAYARVILFYTYKASAGTDTIKFWETGSRQHAWAAVSYTDVADTSGTWYEDYISGGNSAASPCTLSLSVGDGTTDRLILSTTLAFVNSNSATSVTVAPANSETERSEFDRPGSGSLKPISAQVQEYDTAGAYTMKTEGTDAGLTVREIGFAFALLPWTPPPPSGAGGFFLLFP